jgi:hypothetical protein
MLTGEAVENMGALSSAWHPGPCDGLLFLDAHLRAGRFAFIPHDLLGQEPLGWIVRRAHRYLPEQVTERYAASARTCSACAVLAARVVPRRPMSERTTNRLFVGIRLDASMRAQLARQLGAGEPGSATPQMRWIPAANWHIALQFFGSVADAKLIMLADACRRLDPLVLQIIGQPSRKRR